MRINLAAATVPPLLATPALTQNAPSPAAVAGQPISVLMLLTLGTGFVLVTGALFWVLLKRSNRKAAERALNRNNT